MKNTILETFTIIVKVKLSLWSAIKMRIANISDPTKCTDKDYFRTLNRYGKK